MGIVQWVAVLAGLLLQVLLISALLRGPYRQFPMLFVFAVGELLFLVAGTAAIFDLGKWNSETAKYYWVGEVTQQVFIFAVLLHLLSRALGEQSRARLIHFVLIGITYALLALWIAHDPRQNLWMTQWVRNISFGSIFLNLTLWMILLRYGDRQILMITAAFGMQFATTAIGHSLRQLGKDLVTPGNLVLSGGYLLCLYTLYRAMKMLPKEAMKQRESPVG